MSFDLAVWYEPGRISASLAAEKYKSLCDSSTSAAGVVVSDAVTAFHRALVVDFPELSDSAADSPRVEASPWTSGLDVSDAHVIMPISWGRADEIAPAVLALAGRHGLVCFDPQAEVLHLPPALREANGLGGTDGAGVLRLQPCVGLNVEGPDLDVIDRAVRQLSADNWFLILEKPEGRYVQVGQGPNAGVNAGEFAVEHRDGSMERHYRCVLSDEDQVAVIFAEFASGAEAWSVDVRWERMWG
ncbi:hypothetical protein [Streptomyces pseudovenezuelae]|uniref:ATP-grasp domain-containing protein n=1 Tax=Streptomyces pseudovenezuelae TaxID=67350 RepID=A0ABT6LLU2_9ACTN|nr:hypothetical protein [Streptomyces pseudovenezuelae]MDH6217277.1 hypothetical protein [Streptomyces pseudovenezuelae]